MSDISRDAQRVVIQSPNTDVLLLCVTHSDEIECDELWFGTGVKDRLRDIPAHKVAAGVRLLMCKVLPAFHALTGCDTTSALSDVDSVTATEAEALICSLHKVSNRIPTIADEVRSLPFCQKAESNLQLPPASSSLL